MSSRRSSSAYSPNFGLDESLYRTLMVIAAVGTVLAAAYLLWLYQRTAFGTPTAEFAAAHAARRARPRRPLAQRRRQRRPRTPRRRPTTTTDTPTSTTSRVVEWIAWTPFLIAIVRVRRVPAT